MNKKDFVQRWIIRTAPKPDEVNARIDQAESLWSALNARDYGDAKKTGTLGIVNYYHELTPEQKPCFDRFWTAFGKVGHRNEAAMSWIKLSPDAETAERIISAAGRENLREHAGSRKHAQGWLSGLMFDDLAPVKTEVKTKPADDGGLQHAREMLKMCKPDDTVHIKYFEDQIKQAERKHHGD
jgi:hypothetical protein